MKKKLFLVGMGMTVLLASCSDDFKFVSEGIPQKDFDASQPVAARAIVPDSGLYNSQFVVSGSNFGTDLSRIKVYFGDGALAHVISSTGDAIYGLVPSQPNGRNAVSVVIDGKYKSELPAAFKYSRTEQITTVTGKGNTSGNKDGSLGEAAFKVLRGICIVDDDNILVTTDFPNVRLVSENDNAVTTVATGVKFGDLCANKSRDTAYGIQFDGAHALYSFTKDKGWAGTQLLSSLGSGLSGKICGCALDDDEKELYFYCTNGAFGKIDLDTYAVTIIKEKIGDLGSVNDNWCFMAYDKFNDWFYVTSPRKAQLFKVTKDGQAEVYAGTTDGYRDGLRTEAQFSVLTGVAVDDNGGIYLTDTKNGLLRYLKGDYVTTVAGIQGKSNNVGPLDGKPKEAIIRWGYTMDFDSNGTLYFVECNAGTIRKYVNQ